ncbi:nuclear transport factor 2 family protein [Jatrophihabitans fulvus]
MSSQGYGGPNDPQYPGDSFTVPPRSPQPPARGNRGVVIGALSSVILAGLVVIVLAVAGVFSGSDTPAAAQPRDVVNSLLEASQRQDLDAVKQVVCRRDLSDPDIEDVVSDDGHATRFTIGKVTDLGGDRAEVEVSITSSTGTDSAKLPVVKENGAWKVCLSEIDTKPTDFPSEPTGSDSGSSTPSTPSSPGTTSSGTSGFSCASDKDAQSTARLFISYITLGNASSAYGCVYPGTVSESDVQALTGDGKLYSPSLPSSATGPDFSVESSDGQHTLRFRVERRSDGRYYVTSASD